MARGQLSAVELTRSCLDRIDTFDSRLHSFITVDEEGAMAAAAAADTKRDLGDEGKLLGIPLSIKDLICTEAMATTCGSKMLANFIAPYDAAVVENIRAAGGIMVGKTTMDEFAMGSSSETCCFGAPANPYNTDFVPGGSSGGSAVSVAAAEALGSLGSDTGGSIRQPAALCGVVGMKPTYGRVSRYGLVAFGSSLDQIGPITRDVTDCALMLAVVAGYDRRDSTSVNRPVEDYPAALRKGMDTLRIGVPREFFQEGIDLEVEGVVRGGIDMLSDAGATVVEVTLPHIKYGVAAYYLIASAEASSNLARYDGVAYGFRAPADELLAMYKDTRTQGFGEEVKRRILIGTYALSSGYYDAYYKKASQIRTLIIEDFKAAFCDCDVLVSPVSPTPAWRIGAKTDDPLAMYLSDIFTLSTNLAGLPGISVPGGFSGDGLPIGIQLQAPHFHESVLLRAAYNLELQTELANHLPSL
jgi:aspartyl-tRNA(Asn)/glutamyl-tRNA(Gln) amidotransferase subunit A